MAVTSDALQGSGGRATLITTRVMNYGMGALRHREGQQLLAGAVVRQQQSNPYKRACDEQQLKLPLDTSANNAESKRLVLSSTR